jgi:superfamily II DNA or RNA helicase
VFDKLVSVATIQDLTDMGFLAPIRYFAPVQPDLSGVKLTAGDYNAKQLEPAMMDGHLIGDMLEHWLKYGEDRKTVIFATGVAHSIAIKDRFNAAEIPTCHIDGTTPKEDRDEVLSRFKRGDIKIIVNCQILTEGVDVPDVGCVVLARPTKSLVMYMQMVGRGMRVIEGKTDLILIDHAGACYEHGFVHEITEWELSETKQTTNKENEKRKKKESRPITCPMCSCTYSKRLKCPECGNIPERAQFGKEVDHIDGVLGEICFKSKAAKIKPATSVEKRDWFSQLKTYGEHKGFKPGWASNTFREKWGVWPNKYKDAETIPFDMISLEVLDYIKYKRIRLAKSKDKAHVSV